jgi:lipocalin
MQVSVISALSLLILLAAGGAQARCPEVTTQDEFNLEEFVRATWYVQRQQVNSYQPEESLFCVTATYEDEGKKQWFKTAISVYNYSNEKKVNGKNYNDGEGQVLCATETDNASKLGVAPCFLPSFLSGPYWVVAAGPDPDNYEWAIVSGGQPTIDDVCDDGTCTTAIDAGFLNWNGNNEGLWLFTREQVAAQQTLDEMEAVAAEKGICTAQMVDVPQKGCKYVGARIKK